MVGLLLGLGASAAAQGPSGLELTEQEQGWLRAHPRVRVAHDLHGPFAFADERGQTVGLSLDTLALISARTGLQFETTLVHGVQEAFDGVRSGRFDAVMGIGEAPEREAFLRFGVPYAYSPDAIVARSGSSLGFDLRELGGQALGISSSSPGLADELRRSVPEATVVPYPSMEEAVLAVSRGEVFAAVVDASVAAFTVKQRRLTNVRVGELFNPSAGIYLGARRDWPELGSITDKALLAMTAGERTQVSNRWLSIDFEPNRRWQQAFRLSLFGSGVGLLAFLGLWRFNRRLNQELAQRRVMHADLERTRDALARISAEKTELLHMVAHDLRTPLAALLLNTEYLLTGTLATSPAARETLGDMKTSMHQLRVLIDVLVDRQALETGERTWTYLEIDAAREAAAAVTEAVRAGQRKRIEVRLSAQPDLAPFQTDREAFRQVVENLTSNAVKYSPLGARVEVEVTRSGAFLRVTVSDRGPGVAPEQREAIFSKYARGSARPTGGEPSTGLGLWIVARIVDHLEGRVWCEGHEGGGSRFVVELPLERGALAGVVQRTGS